jgi:hypothetical protein
MAAEKKLQTKILNDLRSLGRMCFVTKIEKCSDDGVPDILFSTQLTGAWLIEVKRPGEEPDLIQASIISKCCQCGLKSTFISSWDQWIRFKKMTGMIDAELIRESHQSPLTKYNYSV